MDVSVFGTGYVGLIQAAALADVGHRVLCVDIDPNKIRQLQQAVPPISEPGLSGTLEENIKAGRLLFTTQASDAVEHNPEFLKEGSALLHTAENAGMPLKLLRSVTDVNDHQRHILFSKLKAHFPGGLAGKSIAVWGLAFKPNTDDMREAPSRYLMEALWAEGASVQAYDPEAMSECRRIYGYRDDLHLCATRDDTLEDADALVICTEWKNFRVVDFDRLASKLRNRVIVDGRNLYSPEQVAAAGLHYSGIGLRHIVPEAVRP